MLFAEQDSIQYVPIPHPKVWKFSTYLDALLARPGRFNSVLSRTERLSLSLLQKLSEISGVGGGSYLPEAESSVPPAWQLLLHYLVREGILADPHIQFVKIWNDEPKVCRVGLTPTLPEGKTDGAMPRGKPHGYVTAKGVSHDDFEEALSKAVGELLERYTLLLYRQRDLIPASTRTLRKKKAHFLDPFLVAGFSEQQKRKYPDRNFAQDSVFYWTEGISVTYNRPALIPAQLAFWNYRPLSGEPVLAQRTTNGAAGGFTSEEAIRSGLYELIQRDAFLHYWLRSESPPRIELETIESQDVRETVRAIKRYHLKLEVCNITSDIGVPVFLAALLDDSGVGPPLAVGAGCGGGNPERIVLTAALEAIAVRYAYRNDYQKLLREGGFYPLPSEPFSAPETLEDRANLWENPAMRKHFEFFLQGPLQPLSAVIPNNESLTTLVKRMARRGPEYEVFAYQAAHPVLAKVGYAAAKVSVPAIIPLHLDERYAALGAERIGTPTTFNTIPHPFP